MNQENSVLKMLRRDISPGRLEWIGLRTKRKGEVVEVQNVQALFNLGLEGDHRCEKSPGSGRQVTIVSREYIEQIARHLNRSRIEPYLVRRNLVVSGMNLNLLRYQQLHIGDAIFELNALCHPCSRMNSVLGQGGATAMFGYGGYCAKVIQGGLITLGDKVILID